MRWSDEPYVKFYRRVTADMLAWNWQAKALWPWLLARADNAGLVDTGKRDPIGAVSLLVGLPREVCATGLDDLTADGCLEALDGGFLIRNYVEAQEATKTPRQAKRDQRTRERDKRRSVQRGVILTLPVIDGHAESSPVIAGPPPTPTPTPTPTPFQNHAGEPPAAPAVPAVGEERPSTEDFKRLWNEKTTPPIPRWEDTPRSRRTLVGNALKRRPIDGPTGWALVFERIEACAYLRGGGESGWVADIDWALRADGKKPEPARRVLEGFYDRLGTGPPGRAGGAREVDIRKSPIRAEDVTHSPKTGDVTLELLNAFKR